MELLNEAFDVVYFIPGNHDLYYRDKRDIQSVEWAKHLPNVRIINDWFSDGDVTIAPWLVGDDHKRVQKLKGKYCFGHFELPHFYMNAMVQMPDTGEIQAGAFNGFEKVFSGHFHKRQEKGNIIYLGNCFPHNYADAGDDARGMMILEWGKEQEYRTWPDQPMYRVYNLSDVLRTPEALLLPNMHCRVNLDIDITYEEATFIKETFVGTYNLRELTLLPVKNADIGTDIMLGNIQFESIDSIVTSQLTNIASDHYDPNLLLDIYRHLLFDQDKISHSKKLYERGQ